jgi:hypothetical protein
VWPAPEEGGVTTEWHSGEITAWIRHWTGLIGRDPEAEVVAWVEGDRKFIVATDGKVEAYDLVADPLELQPLALAPEEHEAALLRASRWWDEHPPFEGLDAQGQDVEFDDEHLERLRGLGYLDG